MNQHGVIFDFNGTLFFDSHYHNQVWKQISEELRGTALSDKELNLYVHGKNNEKIIDYITGHSLSREEKERISKQKEAQYRKMVAAHPDTSVLVPGAISLFEELTEAQIPFTIASASIKENIDFFISFFHLERWIDPITITYDDGTYEDKVAMFQDAARKLHVPVHECVIFEDSHSGIQFAKAAGVKAIMVIDAQRQPQAYRAYPYIKGVYEDFCNIHIADIF